MFLLYYQRRVIVGRKSYSQRRPKRTKEFAGATLAFPTSANSRCMQLLAVIWVKFVENHLRGHGNYLLSTGGEPHGFDWNFQVCVGLLPPT